MDYEPRAVRLDIRGLIRAYRFFETMKKDTSSMDELGCYMERINKTLEAAGYRSMRPKTLRKPIVDSKFSCV